MLRVKPFLYHYIYHINFDCRLKNFNVISKPCSNFTSIQIFVSSYIIWHLKSQMKLKCMKSLREIK